MSLTQENLASKPSQILEKVDVVEKLVDKFRRQVQHTVSLEKKIRLLKEELKQLEVSIKTSSKEINLKLKDIKESSAIFTEAVDPTSQDWEMQYLLRKAEDEFHETETLLESFFEKNLDS